MEPSRVDNQARLRPSTAGWQAELDAARELLEGIGQLIESGRARQAGIQTQVLAQISRLEMQSAAQGVAGGALSKLEQDAELLRQRATVLENALEAAREEAAKWRRERDSFERDLEARGAAQTGAVALQGTLDAARRESEALRQALQISDHERSQSEQALREHRSLLESARAAGVALDARAEEFVRQSVQLERADQRKRLRLQELEQELRKVRTTAETSAEELRLLRAETGEKSRTIEALRQQVHSLTGLLVDATAATESREQTLQARDGALQEAAQRQAILVQRLEQRDVQLQLQAEQIAALKRADMVHEETLLQREAAIDALKNQYALVKESLVDAQAALEDAGASDATLRAKQADLAAGLVSTRGRLEESEQELARLREVIETTVREKEGLENALALRAAAWESVETEKVQLTAALERAEERLVAEEDSAKALKTELDRALAERAELVDRMAAEETVSEVLRERLAGLEEACQRDVYEREQELEALRLRDAEQHEACEADKRAWEQREQALTHALEENQARLDAYSETETALREECRVFKEREQTFVAERLQAESTLAALRMDQQALEEALAEERATTAAARGEAAQRQAALEEAHARQAALEHEHAVLRASLAAADEARDHEMRERLEESGRFSAELEAARARVNEQAARISELESQIEAASARVREQQDALAAAEQRDGELRGRLEAQHQLTEGLRGELSEQITAVASLNARSGHLEAALASLRLDHEREKGSLAELRSLTESQKEVIAERNATLSLVQRESSELERRAREAETQAQSLRAEVRQAMQEVSAAMRERDQAIETLSAAGQQTGARHAPAAAREAAHEMQGRERMVLAAMLCEHGRMPLGALLVESGLITVEQLHRALQEQERTPGQLLGSVLMHLDYATEETIAQAIACQLQLPHVYPQEQQISKEVVQLIPRDLCLWHVCLPLRASEGQVAVAMANPLDEVALRKLREASRREVAPCVATPTRILAAVETLYGDV